MGSVVTGVKCGVSAVLWMTDGLVQASHALFHGSAMFVMPKKEPPNAADLHCPQLGDH